MILFYLSGCCVEQIAQIIHKPPGTVKSRLFKGRSLMEKRLEADGSTVPGTESHIENRFIPPGGCRIDGH